MNKRQKRSSVDCKRQRCTSDKETTKIDVTIKIRNHKDLLRELKIIKNSVNVVDVIWQDEGNEAEAVKNSRDPILQGFGYRKNNRFFLYPEEVLYFLEMNRAQLFYLDVRLSFQRSYSMMFTVLSKEALPQVEVFKELVMRGYTLTRSQKIGLRCQLQSHCNTEDEPAAEKGDITIFRKLSYNMHWPKTVTNIESSELKQQRCSMEMLRSSENMWTCLQSINANAGAHFFAINSPGKISMIRIENVEIPRCS